MEFIVNNIVYILYKYITILLDHVYRGIPLTTCNVTYVHVFLFVGFVVCICLFMSPIQPS